MCRVSSVESYLPLLCSTFHPRFTPDPLFRLAYILLPQAAYPCFTSLHLQLILPLWGFSRSHPQTPILLVTDALDVPSPPSPSPSLLFFLSVLQAHLLTNTKERTVLGKTPQSNSLTCTLKQIGLHVHTRRTQHILKGHCHCPITAGSDYTSSILQE